MVCGMDDGILLMCTFLQINALIWLYDGILFTQLVNTMCVKFDGLITGEVCMLFNVLGYKKFKVDSDDDIKNMLCLAKTFSGTIYPIPTMAKLAFTPDDYIIAPPKAKRPPGRPKRKRIPLKGEVVQRIRCVRCGQFGNHNRKACKEPI
ncbi:hypothetical protein ACSBR2_035399 [Camellia fascicularis]